LIRANAATRKRDITRSAAGRRAIFAEVAFSHFLGRLYAQQLNVHRIACRRAAESSGARGCLIFREVLLICGRKDNRDVGSFASDVAARVDPRVARATFSDPAGEVDDRALRKLLLM
jgi:hypothetical protein